MQAIADAISQGKTGHWWPNWLIASTNSPAAERFASWAGWANAASSAASMAGQAPRWRWGRQSARRQHCGHCRIWQPRSSTAAWHTIELSQAFDEQFMAVAERIRSPRSLALESCEVTSWLAAAAVLTGCAAGPPLASYSYCDRLYRCSLARADGVGSEPTQGSRSALASGGYQRVMVAWALGSPDSIR